MKFKKLIATLLSCLLLVTVLSSCDLMNYTIEGTWKELDAYVGLCKFNSNGTFEIQAVGYYITGTYEYEEGEMKEVNDKNTVEGTVTMEYEEVTYTNKKGEEVTEPFTYTYITTETEIVEVEKQKNIFSDEVVIVEEERVIETKHTGKLAEPLTGKYVISEQSTSAEALTIYFDDKIEIIDEDGEKVEIDLSNTTWKFERSYSKL